MKEGKDYAVLAAFGSQDKDYRFQFVKDMHGRGFAIIRIEKKPFFIFPFIKISAKRWYDLAAMPRIVDPNDDDFDDAFTHSKSLITKYLLTLMTVYQFKETSCVSELLQSLEDDERGRYVI